MKSIMTMTWYIALFCVALTISAQAQQSTSGRVVDIGDKGIQGALIAGTLTCQRPFLGPMTFTNTTNTIEDGSYILNFPFFGTSGSSCMSPSISIDSVNKQGYDFVSNDGRNYIGVELPRFVVVSAADYG